MSIEQSRKRRGRFRATDRMYEVDSDLNSGRNMFEFMGNVQQLLFDQSYLGKYKTSGRWETNHGSLPAVKGEMDSCHRFTILLLFFACAPPFSHAEKYPYIKSIDPED